MSDLTTRPTRVDTHKVRVHAHGLVRMGKPAAAHDLFDLAADLDATREELARALAAAPCATTYTFTGPQLYKALCEAIGLAREFEAVHGHDADIALFEGAREVMDGLDAERELIAHGEMRADQATHILPGEVSA